AGALTRIHKADGNNDSPNVNHNAVNKELSCSDNDPMVRINFLDMDNGEVAVAGMGIHMADEQNDIPNANDNSINQGIIVPGDGMGIDKADENNDYTYSQREPSTLDVLVQGFGSQKNHQGIDVIQHDTHVDCSIAKLNGHLTADISVTAVPVDEFADDFMNVLNDEESIPNCSLDDMKLQDEEEKLISTPVHVNHQQVNEFIDVHEDKTNVLQENVKYVNVVKEDKKPCLGMVFANVKAKRKKCGIERNYVLRSVKEIKKRLAMSLDSLFGQQATTTLAPPKTISKSVNEDFIAPPEFLEQLSRPHNCIMDKVTLPDGGSMIDYYFNDVRYPVACQDVEKVNEPKKHWCLAELHIFTGVVTFYDSLGWVCGNRRPWWRMMKRTLPQQLTLYLNEHEALQSTGIAVETYEIKYMFPKVVREANDYGDCGVWVCIFLYKLSRNLPLTVDDPLQTVLAYRERILQYFWRHKIQAGETVVLDEGGFRIAKVARVNRLGGVRFMCLVVAGKVNLTAPTISFPKVKKHEMFSIINKPVHGIIYKNSKKEKRLMRHLEIHEFCDATLNRVLEGLKSYNNDV
nr:ulp1 protease family, C-terminal catalytic domain-containing protein [Tanacetum cinerariifolium]